jgi:hypothetical protein
MKLKIFNPAGEILYSTSPEEIGQINSKEYFHEVVAKGYPYTKVIKKDAKSLEGQKVTVDVVETYVPIMGKNKHDKLFKGRGHYRFMYIAVI